MNTILITGGAGFIGCNLLKYMLLKYPDYQFINFDALTYAGRLENISQFNKYTNYTFVHGDITKPDQIQELFDKYFIDHVIHLAAESHVDRSIETPFDFTSTNVLGTQILLDASYKNNVKKFLQVSTDEVYGSLGDEGLFTEETPLSPNSPYAASKAGADLIAYSYYKTYGFPINITRCSNNYGPFQFPEKLIPLMITYALEGKPLPIYGDGKQIRDWLHVDDHCEAIDIVLHDGLDGEIYNIGGNNEKSNLEVVETILGVLGINNHPIEQVKDRLGHDRRYAIDSSKIKNKLEWQPKIDFNIGINNTLQWYLQNKSWWGVIVNGVGS